MLKTLIKNSLQNFLLYPMIDDEIKTKIERFVNKSASNHHARIIIAARLYCAAKDAIKN